MLKVCGAFRLHDHFNAALAQSTGHDHASSHVGALVDVDLHVGDDCAETRFRVGQCEGNVLWLRPLVLFG